MLPKRRWGEHLSDGAKDALARQRRYPVVDTLRNPLTRALARSISDSEWISQVNKIDFAYELTTESIADVSCVRMVAGEVCPEAPLIVFLHGGGFVSGASRTNAAGILPTCHYAKAEVVSIDYSLAPEFTFPKALDEIEAVYRELQRRENGKRKVVFAGESAGGNLALATMYRLRDAGEPLPNAAILFSPSIDGTRSSDTVCSHRNVDPILRVTGAISVKSVYDLYADGVDLTDPLISPLFGDMAGLPPMLVHVGSRELLLGESARLIERACEAGVDAHLRLHDGMFHLFHMHWDFPEGRKAHQQNARFLRGLSD